MKILVVDDEKLLADAKEPALRQVKMDLAVAAIIKAENIEASDEDVEAEYKKMAEQFGMEYVDADGKKKRPYIIHRTSLGCYERTLAYLIEKYAGALPLWMMPTQVRILPITDRAHDYAEGLVRQLKAAGIRTEGDFRSEKLGYKIREDQKEKIPYMLVVGAKEEEENTVSVRSRFAGDEGAKSLDDFIAAITEEIKNRENRKVEVEEQK